jgi:CYTH domain-containing protein
VLEVERKFLVSELPAGGLDERAATGIDQGYLAIGADGSEVRLRRRAGRHTLTVKSGGGLTRSESEIELSAEQFEQLWPATETRRLEKVRYEIPVADAGLTIELDIYTGSLDGLIVAEVEFQGEAAAGEFTPPGWFGQEVTADEAYKNRRLAVDGRPGKKRNAR